MRECCYRFSRWKVLLVDDEEDVLSITRFALEGYRYYDRSLEFLTASSAKEAMEILEREQDIAVIFLDIIMEHDEAGFDVIRHLRDELHDYRTRIVIRTGEPGEYPETEVVRKYEINDYKSKGELTEEQLYCTMTTALRSYCDLLMLEHYKNSENVMIHKSKLMLFGEMMGMMLHQWQQPISSINLISDIAEDDLERLAMPEEERGQLLEYVAKVKEQVAFLGTISRDFRQFFKTSRAQEEFSVKEAVEKTLFIIGDLVRKKDITINIDISEEAVLYGDKNEFKHVVLNLIKNSMDAYDCTGEEAERYVGIEFVEGSESRRLTYKDKAGGIDATLLPNRIFEPYNTSKQEGSGIGMWMCKLIIESNMNGALKASNEGDGARFDMLFVRS